MPEVHFDRFYKYAELSRILHQFAEQRPELFRLQSIGKSYEGRDIWVVVATKFSTGPDSEKPALWVDGNIHASELATSAACLYHLQALAQGYGRDEQITRSLDTGVFYICPRINPDGAEWALADRPRIVRSSTRPYPYDESPVEGLYAEDIDGDGRILSMRVADANGGWKEHPEDGRLMVRRDPVESGGQYYRLLPEGRLKNYDGATIQVKRPREGLDLNRNFPFEWRGEKEQQGAGPYPTSEPEVRAVADFIAARGNIVGGVSFHTFSGVLLRPYSTREDEAFPAEDLWTYKKIGERGTQLTGYPNISVYHEFRYHPKEVITGVWDDWLYEHLGIFGWTVELWSPQRQAGIEKYQYIDWRREHPPEDDLKLLRWSDEKLGGRGYVDWYEYEHPELGRVELGGWDRLHYITNPPPDLLQKEIEPFPRWLVWHLLIAPRLELFEASCEKLAEGAFRVRLVVHNTGWLPTYVSKKALEKGAVRALVAEIELPEGAHLKSGLPRQECGQLEGRAYQYAASFLVEDSTTERAKVEWVVGAPAGGKIRLLARHPRAGVVRATLELE